MSLKDQLKTAEETELLQKEYEESLKKHQDTKRKLNEHSKTKKDIVYKRIFRYITVEVETNGLSISGDFKKWNFSNSTLEYKGNFTSEPLFIERRIGNAYKKVEFIVLCEKPEPNTDLSFNLLGLNPIEQEQKKIEIISKNIKDMEAHFNSIQNDNFKIFYKYGEQGVHSNYNESDFHKYTQIDEENFCKLLFE